MTSKRQWSRLIGWLLCAAMLLTACPAVFVATAETTRTANTVVSDGKVYFFDKSTSVLCEKASDFGDQLPAGTVTGTRETGYTIQASGWQATVSHYDGDSVDLSGNTYLYYDFTVTGSRSEFLIRLNAWTASVGKQIAAKHGVPTAGDDGDTITAGTFKGILNIDDILTGTLPENVYAILGVVRGPVTVRALDILNVTDVVDESDLSDPAGSGNLTLSGTVTDGGVGKGTPSLRLYRDGKIVTSAAATNGQYAFTGLTAGTYTLLASKSEHANRSYDVTLTDANAVQNIELHVLGDVNGDKRINVADYGLALAHVREIQLLSGYAFTCADINGDGKVNVADYGRILAYVRGVAPISGTLPTSSGIEEGTLSTEETALFASGNHQTVQWSALPDATATKRQATWQADGSFFDDFANGIDSAHWHLVQQQWGGGNHGVIRENVGYTADGTVVLTAHGDYYQGDANNGNGTRTGACLATKTPLGPGSYEVRMKVLPRMGTCTAMWTYFNDGSRNHEIDIELPGNTKDFHFSLFTNWLTESRHTSRSTIPNFDHNDGEWHTYRFDWHTDDPHIDYYVDGKLELTTRTNVPTAMGYFWLGVWFPQNWCGDPAFETAYMLIDWVKYTAYNETKETTNPRFASTPANAYPTSPVTLPVNNYAADGSFTYGTRAVWTTTGNAARVQNPVDDSKMLRLDDQWSSVSQVISSVNGNATYKLTAAALASVSGSNAKVLVEYLDENKNQLSGAAELTFGTRALTPKSTLLNTPAGTHFLRITLSGEGVGTFYFDDLFVTQPTRDDFVTAF